MPADDLDLASFWMPFTDNRYFKAHPRLLQTASGMEYRTTEGRTVLDATAGLWCVNAGHGRQQIVEAIQKAAAELDFAPTFQLGHPGPFRLASKLAKLMPSGMDRIFFTNSGSEAADTALKIALAFHRAAGAGSRTRLIGRDRGYHGTNFGGTSVGGIGGNRRGFGAQVWGVDHLADTYRKEHAFSRGMPETNEDMAIELERLVALHGAETIAAVIIEPLAASTGVLIPPKGYLQRIREITARHGILLIFDEVVTAFGRLGSATASEFFGVKPDIITMAKGLTNAAVPMGAVAVDRAIHDRIIESSGPGVEFFHGYTYSGHPLGAAAAIATLALYDEEGLFARAASLASYWEDAAHELRERRHVGDVRNLGLVAAIELSSRSGAPGSRATQVFRRCFDEGLLIRVTGDIIALSPPLIVEKEQIDRIFTQIGTVLDEVD